MGISRNEFLCGILKEYMEESIARGIVKYALGQAQEAGPALLSSSSLSSGVFANLAMGIDLFVEDGLAKHKCKQHLTELSLPASENNRHGEFRAGMPLRSEVPAQESVRKEPGFAPLTTISVETENDIVLARSQSRHAAEAMGFNRTEQIKIATAVSELARNVVRYAGFGEIEIAPTPGARLGIMITCRDYGQGISNLEEILSGRYKSKTGLGLGLLGVKKIMDEFQVQTGSNGTVISVRKYRS